ncbi:hypothetical protein [Microbacterium sp. J1-1]|uniref:hypothetical protein n=1 Tax=Microbacterium sp. J1-1 TaxID=2992441 RepID=UPI0021151206|nr:hypothetical protein [Microbacterium sp. J1-1]UUE19359.1 hypothetical protein LRQ07_11110 [Microbacterium sp. J1-1]
MNRTLIAGLPLAAAVALAGCSATAAPEASIEPTTVSTTSPTPTPEATVALPAPSSDPQADFVAKMRAAFPDMASGDDADILAVGNRLCEADRTGDWLTLNADPNNPTTAQALAIAKSTLCA